MAPPSSTGVRWLISAPIGITVLTVVLSALTVRMAGAASEPPLPTPPPAPEGTAIVTATGTVIVELNGMQSDAGRVAVAMWNNPDDWLSDNNTVRQAFTPITDGRSRLEFSDVPFGDYAISAYHDVNGNGELDTSLLGIPKEPLGTSNNVKVHFGPPEFESARFTLSAERLTLVIQLSSLF